MVTYPNDISLDVTREIIDACQRMTGSPGYDSSTDCPIATAAKMKFPGTKVYTGANSIRIGDAHYRCLDPRRQAEFVARFDFGRDVNPACFEYQRV